MRYHKLATKIKNILKEHNYWFKTFKHKPVRTSQEAAKTRPGYSIEQGAKAIIVRIKKSSLNKRFVMLVFPANLKFNNKKVKNIFSAKDIRFATEQEVLKLTDGVKLGAIPPFGNLFELEVIADKKLFDNEKIVFNAGDRKLSIAMYSKDYKALVNPKIISITL